MPEACNDCWPRDLFYLTVHHCCDFLKRTAQIIKIWLLTACLKEHSLDLYHPTWALQTRIRREQSCSCTAHSEWFTNLSAYSKLSIRQTCDTMPLFDKLISCVLYALTPSKTNTVELLQSADYLVRADAKYFMKSIRTLLSVLQVVSAIQTSPSDDRAVIMLIFWLSSLSGAVLRIPLRFHRFCRKSEFGIQDSSTLMTRFPDW